MRRAMPALPAPDLVNGCPHNTTRLRHPRCFGIAPALRAARVALTRPVRCTSSSFLGCGCLFGGGLGTDDVNSLGSPVAGPCQPPPTRGVPVSVCKVRVQGSLVSTVYESWSRISLAVP
eukprot:3903905-Rhodomonas_salina.1